MSREKWLLLNYNFLIAPIMDRGVSTQSSRGQMKLHQLFQGCLTAEICRQPEQQHGQQAMDKHHSNVAITKCWGFNSASQWSYGENLSSEYSILGFVCSFLSRKTFEVKYWLYRFKAILGILKTEYFSILSMRSEVLWFKTIKGFSWHQAADS